MDIHLFLKEYRSFRQKVGEELGLTDEELILKFYLAFKRLQKLSENPFKSYSQIFEQFLYKPSNFARNQNPDSDENNDDPFGNDSGTSPYYPFR
jgi:hypothetical protein